MNLPGISFIAIPLGYILWFIYHLLGNYFIAIFLFTLVIRAATFPLSLKSQKMQADRARLAPRLERLQKKYAKDRKKLQEKQMALYEKEGVSMTGGCLPMLIQMVVLFGVIAVIYAPLTHLSHIPKPVVNASIEASAQLTKTDENGDTVEISDVNKLSSKERKESYYYRELRLLMVMESNKQEIMENISQLSEAERKNISAEKYYTKMQHLRKDFSFFGNTLLKNPWDGMKNINILWLIPLFSWLTALGSSLLSMKFMNLAAAGQKQPGQGCNNAMMIAMLPLFSLFITFTVPGGVGIYWICSNVISIAQTIILNRIYNPVKIRAQAEIEYEERRRRKQEDKKRLAEARAREQSEVSCVKTEEKKKGSKNSKSSSKNANKKKQVENKKFDKQKQENSDAETSLQTESKSEQEVSKNQDTQNE